MAERPLLLLRALLSIVVPRALEIVDVSGALFTGPGLELGRGDFFRHTQRTIASVIHFPDECLMRVDDALAYWVLTDKPPHVPIEVMEGGFLTRSPDQNTGRSMERAV